MKSPTHWNPCRGLGSGPHGYFAEVDMVPANFVLDDPRARGWYCQACAAFRMKLRLRS